MPEQKTYSAKQVATRIGTDAKTFRKFLRSPASDYEAVGQGSRYEFKAEDLKDIHRSFNRWQSKKRVPAKPAAPTPKATPKIKVNDEITLAIDLYEDPTEEELDRIQEELEAHFPNEEFTLEED